MCVAAKTDPKVGWLSGHLHDRRRGEKPYSDIAWAARLKKVGMHEIEYLQELFFDDVHVPAANLLGTAEGAGFSQMMEQLPYERLMTLA